MPDKKGRFTVQEQGFVEAMVRTGDPVYAGHKAGYSARSHALAKASTPAIIAEIERRNLEESALRMPKAWAAVDAALEPTANPKIRADMAWKVITKYQKDKDNLGEGASIELTAEDVQAQLGPLLALQRALEATEAEVIPDEGGVFD